MTSQRSMLIFEQAIKSEILKKRFAKGEISKEEYDEMKSVLE